MSRIDRILECSFVAIAGLALIALMFIGYQLYVSNHIAEYDIATIHGDACTPNSIIPNGTHPGIDGMAPPSKQDDGREF